MRQGLQTIPPAPGCVCRPHAMPPPALHNQAFASDQCPEGFVAVSRSTLRILSVDNVGDAFNATTTRLRYTPRRLLVHPTWDCLLVAESDHGAVPLEQREDLQERLQVCVGVLWAGWRLRSGGWVGGAEGDHGAAPSL